MNDPKDEQDPNSPNKSEFVTGPPTKEIKNDGETSIENTERDPKYKHAGDWFRDLFRQNADRHTELILSVAIAFFACCQLVVTCNNNRSTSQQVDKIITAANGIKGAADSFSGSAASIKDSANAFSQSAASINTGVNAAVDKLNLQAEELKQSVQQASRLANETAKANENVVGADRPWVGVESYPIDNFEEGKTAKLAITYINTGKRPATASIVYGTREFVSLPSDPISMANQIPSVAFILPGGRFSASIDYPVELGLRNRLAREKKLLFFVAEIIYTDVGTNQAYITHFCAYWSPTTKTFPLCSRYNQAK